MKIKFIFNESDFTKSPSIDVHINYEEKNIFFVCNDDLEFNIFATLFNNVGKNLYLFHTEDVKITLCNFFYRRETDNSGNKYISLLCEKMYISNLFITDEKDLSNLKKVKIEFGNNTVIPIDEKIISLITYKFKFNYNSLNFEFQNNVLNIEGNSFGKEEFWTFFIDIMEILWLFYGFCLPIKKVVYAKDKRKITEYISMHYLFYTSKEHIFRDNILIDSSKICSFEKIIDKWINIKKIYGDTFINGLIYSTCEYNKFSDLQICTLLQSIDGFTQKLYKDNIDINKTSIVEKTIDYIDSFTINEKNKDSFIKYIKNFGTMSFRERLKLFSDSSYEKILGNENFLTLEFEQKENPCKIFNKSNKLYTKCINERNKLSHMVDKDELLDAIENKIYLYKFLLVFRVQILKLMELEDLIDYKNLDRNIDSINNFMIKSKKNCNNCKYLSEGKCRLF